MWARSRTKNVVGVPEFPKKVRDVLLKAVRRNAQINYFDLNTVDLNPRYF